jgi:hypothetical protein
MYFQEAAAANTWQQLFDDPLVNTFGAIHSYCGSSNNPIVGQFVDALKTSIINGLAIRGLCGCIRGRARNPALALPPSMIYCASCVEVTGATPLDDVQSFVRAPDASPPNPSTNHGKETPAGMTGSFHVVQLVPEDMGAALHAGHLEVFSVAYVRGSIARQVLRGVS